MLGRKRKLSNPRQVALHFLPKLLVFASLGGFALCVPDTPRAQDTKSMTKPPQIVFEGLGRFGRFALCVCWTVCMLDPSRGPRHRIHNKTIAKHLVFSGLGGFGGFALCVLDCVCLTCPGQDPGHRNHDKHPKTVSFCKVGKVWGDLRFVLPQAHQTQDPGHRIHDKTTPKYKDFASVGRGDLRFVLPWGPPGQDPGHRKQWPILFSPLLSSPLPNHLKRYSVREFKVILFHLCYT